MRRYLKLPLLQYIEGDMEKLQQALFRNVADGRNWMGFMYEVMHVIGSGSFTRIYIFAGGAGCCVCQSVI